MKTIKLDSYPVLICSDAHTETARLDKIKGRHPEITNRFFLGDLFTFTDPKGNLTTEGNKETGEWLKKNIGDWNFIIGNHDVVCCKNWWQYNLDSEVYNLVAGQFNLSIRLEIQGKAYLLLHSKPKSLWDFINPGYQFRELEEDFLNYEDFRACISGHCHKEFRHVWPDCDFQIWQVGAVRDGRYGILTEKGLEFKKL